MGLCTRPRWQDWPLGDSLDARSRLAEATEFMQIVFWMGEDARFCHGCCGIVFYLRRFGRLVHIRNYCMIMAESEAAHDDAYNFWRTTGVG